jgi:hypothetical protein
MDLPSAIDDLNVFFGTNESAKFAMGICEIHRDDEGNIEVHVLNPEFEEMLIFTKAGKVEAFSVSEFESVVRFNP